jgi:hypothetical protein
MMRARPGLGRGFGGVLGAALMVALALALASSASAASIAITGFDGGAFLQSGEPATQAGSHPYNASTAFTFASAPVASGDFEVPLEDLKDAIVSLPPGLIGNPQAVKSCAAVDFASGGACPLESQVGVFTLESLQPQGRFITHVPLFNLKPPKGTVALLGFYVNFVPVTVYIKVRSGEDYGVTAIGANAQESLVVGGASVDVWGVPADPSHDSDRGQCLQTSGLCPSADAVDPKAFFTLPTSCTGPVRTDLTAVGWLGGKDSASFLSHDNAAPIPNPIGGTGCESLDFSPTLKARPTTSAADSPTGFDVDLHIPQDTIADPNGTVEAHLRDTTVTLPPGLVINPSGANGLDACSPAQIGLKSAPGATPVTYTPDAAQCPDASKVGTVKVHTPLLDHPVPGAVYIATPHANPFDSLLALYLTVDDPQSGVVAKLAGKVALDPASGQITSTFEENPQLPFEDVELSFFGGAGAPLRTPAVCGPYSTTSVLTPWSAPASGPSASPSDSYAISQGPNGSGCASSAAQLANAPAFEAGTTSPIAGAYSPFVVNLKREDGSQEFSAVTLTLPPGLVGRLAGTPPCPDSALAAAGAKSGQAEKASPSCPAASEIGSVIAGAGAGPAPYYAPGKAYLAGPYKGAPLSMAVLTPAAAGPFDLGTIVVRVALKVDPKTAQITAVSDPIPHILEGIPLDVRSIQVKLDKPSFTLNPTSCDPAAVSGQLLSTLGQSASLSSRFQLGECGRLGFKPKMTLSLKGGTTRGDHPALTVVLKPRSGDANLASLSVALPHSEFLDQAHIRTVCTRVQFAANACPPGAIYGHVTVTTPLLDFPLTGPVYLRSSDNLLPDLVPALSGPASLPIKLESAGRVDSIKGGIRNSFNYIPDAPFTKLVVKLPGGKKGLLINSRNICKEANKATVKFGAHNGRRLTAHPVLRAKCGSKAKKKHRRGSSSR